jgi:hypothetical protein
MSAKILKFTPRPKHKFTATYDAPAAVITLPVVKEEVFQPPMVSYLNYLKIPSQDFSSEETTQLEAFQYVWDEKYQAMYCALDDSEIIEKKDGYFFYLYVLPFNMYPCEYKVFSSLESLVSFLNSRNNPE